MRRLEQMMRNPSIVVMANAGAQSAIRFVSNILLAQLLMPAAFALTSLTMLIATGVQMVTDVGIAVTTLRHGSPSPEVQARIWTMQLVRGLMLSAILFLLADPLSRLYSEPELANVLRALCLMTALSGAQSLYPILEMGRQNLMPGFICEVGGRLVGTIASILAALVTPTVWALVIGILLQAVLTTIASHIMAGRLPRFDFHFGFIREHWQFSRWIQLASTLTFIALQIDKALFPFLYSLPRFALYGIGAGFALIPTQVTQKWIGSIHYPMAVNRLKMGKEGLDALWRVRRTMMLYVIVAAIVMMLISPDFFYLLYKPTYHEAGRFAQILAATIYFDVAESTLRHYLLVDRTSRYEFLSTFVRICLFLLCVGAIWMLGLDAPFYALAYVAAATGSYMFTQIACARWGYADIRMDIVPTGVMIAAVAILFLLPDAPGSALYAFGHGMVCGLGGLALIALIYRRRGMPSLPHEEHGEEAATA